MLRGVDLFLLRLNGRVQAFLNVHLYLSDTLVLLRYCFSVIHINSFTTNIFNFRLSLFVCLYCISSIYLFLHLHFIYSLSPTVILYPHTHLFLFNFTSPCTVSTGLVVFIGRGFVISPRDCLGVSICSTEGDIVVFFELLGIFEGFILNLLFDVAEAVFFSKGVIHAHVYVGFSLGFE